MQAIPTLYRGIQMRSRLEAKWACCFDQLGWGWEYEPIDLAGWIPDFVVRIPQLKKPALIEIKPIFAYDRPVTLKIERGLGAPHRSADFDEWEPFFEKLPYEPILCGATPIPWATELPGEPPRNLVALGWHFQNGPGWQASFGYLAETSLLVAAWHQAHNRTQWKAPR